MPIFLKYVLIALTVILLSSLSIFFVMKKTHRAERENIVNLVVGTVLSMICAILTPLLANLLIRELYFSMILSIIVSLAVLLLFSTILFTVLCKNRIKATGEEIVENQQPGLVDTNGTEVRMDGGDKGLAEAPEERAILSGMSLEELDIPFEAAAPALDREAPAFDFDEFAVDRLIKQAQESKNSLHYLDAILAYEAVLLRSPERQLFQWVMVDLCSLYKKTGQIEFIYKALEEHENMLDIEISESILRNL